MRQQIIGRYELKEASGKERLKPVFLCLQFDIMKNFFQQENQQNNQKKGRKHYGKEYSKRPWKTPSPNLNVEFKSPRFMRNGYKDPKDKNKEKEKEKPALKTQQHIEEYNTVSKINLKPKQISHHVQIHEQPPKPDQNKSKGLGEKQLFHHRYHEKNNLRRSATEEELNTYNHYFQKIYAKKKQEEGMKNHTKMAIKQSEQLPLVEQQKPKSYSKLKHNSLFQTNIKAHNQAKGIDNNSISADENQSFGTKFNSASSNKDANQEINFMFSSTKKFQQTIRRYSKQNMKLKKIVEQYSQQINSLKAEKQDIKSEKQKYQTEATELSIRLYELKQEIYKYEVEARREKKTLNISEGSNEVSVNEMEQNLKEIQENYKTKISGLELLLEANEKELNASNLQIYKMKQELFELQLQKNKKKTSKKGQHQFKDFGAYPERDTSYEVSQLERRNNPRNSSKSTSEKQSPAQQYSDTDYIKTEHNSHKKRSQTFLIKPECHQCDLKQKEISELTNMLENKIFEAMKKDGIISNLIQQMKNLQNEIKLFEKPKSIYKKYNFIVGELNQEIMKQGLKQLQKKYEEEQVQSTGTKPKIRGINSKKLIQKH